MEKGDILELAGYRWRVEGLLYDCIFVSFADIASYQTVVKALKRLEKEYEARPLAAYYALIPKQAIEGVDKIE